MNTSLRKRNMTFLLSLCMSALIFLSYSCQKPDNDGILPNSSFKNYDENIQNLAQAVSRAFSESADFRQVVKHEAMKQMDGDYDVLLTQIAGRRLSEYNNLLKKSGPDVCIKDLLDGYLSEGNNQRKSTTPLIDEILSMNPGLQVSVPVHCEDWDPSGYTPVVGYVPSSFAEGESASITGYAPDGSVVQIDAVNEPDEPVVIVGLNERMAAPLPDLPGDPAPPQTPQNLTASQTESGIRLTWTMTAESNSSNTTGYYVYRKTTANSGYEKVETVFNCFNRSYDDNHVEPSKSYSYYVIAFYGSFTSTPSNYVTIVAPSAPKPVVSFNAIQQSNTQVELRWENDDSQSFNSTNLYRCRLGIDDDYKLLKSLDPSTHYYFDNDLVRGKRFTYKVNHVSDLGVSNPKFDFTQVPYRDNSKSSPIYIHAIDFSDWRIESWINGKPEFYVTLSNVNPVTGKSYILQEKIEFNFGARLNHELFPDSKVFDWVTGEWYDIITISVVEYNAFLTRKKITISAAYNLKDLLKKDLLPVSFGGETSYEVGSSSTNCGCVYFNYFDNPECWLRFPSYGVRLLVSNRRFEDVLTSGIPK